MIQLFRDYFEVLDLRQRRRALALVFLLAASGLTEAAALTTLIPLVNPDSVLSADNQLSEALRDLQLDAEGLVRAALAAFIVLGSLSATLKFAAEAAILRMRVRTERDMRVRLTDALVRMRWTAFHAMRLGDISKAIVAEGNNASLGLQVLLQATGNAIIALAFLTCAVLLSPELTIFTMTFAGVIALLYRWVNKHAEMRSRELSAATSRIGEDAEDVFGTLKFVRSTGAVGAARRNARALYDNFAETSFGAHVLISSLRFLFEFSGILFIGAVLLAAILTGEGLTATSVAFLALFYRLAPRLQSVQEQVLLARTYRSWLRTWVSRLESAETEADDRRGDRDPRYESHITLDTVSVRYPGAATNALDEVSLSIPRGSCVAIVGESGSGKSTMLDLLTGLISPTSGHVLLDDEIDSRDVDLAKWQSHIGLVLQETPIYHTTVAENIRWQLSDVSQSKVIACAEGAYARGFIEALPDGFDTVVGERGGRLSGGQRQRIALARALCRDPWLLLLDEATSALDSESERLVLAALERAKGASTIVLVAHRLATAQIADEVVVMSEGRIVQQGSYADLIADRNGPFVTMASAQGLVTSS